MTVCVKVTSDPGNLIKVEADYVPLAQYHDGGRYFLVLKKNDKVVAVFDVAKLDGWWESK